jgi:hypothetical protein
MGRIQVRVRNLQWLNGFALSILETNNAAAYHVRPLAGRERMAIAVDKIHGGRATINMTSQRLT